MTALDFVGPQSVLDMSCKTHLLWKTLDPVPTDTNFSIVPTTTFADCPAHLDVVLVPGGFGSNDAVQDAEILAFLKDRGASADYIPSVCTASPILGAAGLLDEFKAATHWAYYPILDAMKIATSADRVVADRNRVTGGGVTAGIDFALTLLAQIRGVDVAKFRALGSQKWPAISGARPA